MAQQRFVNLTPHTVNVRTPEGKYYEFSSVGESRVKETGFTILEIRGGIEIRETHYDGVIGLPEQEEGVTYIVSAMVRDLAQDRLDLVSPDSGKTAIRENGQVKAVRGFLRPSPL